LQFAIDAAYRGGKSTLAHFQTGAAVTIKSDSSPVTVADLGAERIIRDEIERAFPGESILGEEHGATGNSASRWIIDPIDGTKSFVAGVPTYATLLSYEVNGVPVLGVAKPVVIGHGISHALAFKNMILTAERMIAKDLMQKMKDIFSSQA
jgi:fructose-1,6-bisphosphatase/inositol monophosphatase family enzyme